MMSRRALPHTLRFAVGSSGNAAARSQARHNKNACMMALMGGSRFPSCAAACVRPPLTRGAALLRPLSTSSGGGKDDEVGKNDKKVDEDPFGLSFDDSSHTEETGNIGPPSSFPPNYVRDPTTGKLTGAVEAELTDEERELLSLNQVEKERRLVERLVSGWNEEGVDEETGASERESRVAARIREEELALNTLGRGPAATPTRRGDDEEEDHGDGEYKDPTGFTAPLTEGEFDTFQRYMKREHDTDVTKDDIPVTQRKSSGSGGAASPSSFADPDLDLTWLTAAARREMEGGETDDPFVDLMPSDLNPARKVNRRRAKLLPKELLHHNNLSLLRRYVTPGGQIMNRVQSRLGAKDQRKVAKLIKRARHLGLIPYMGQWKYEDHGNIHEADINEEREWEKDLVERGLWPPKSEKEKMQRLLDIAETVDKGHVGAKLEKEENSEA